MARKKLRGELQEVYRKNHRSSKKFESKQVVLYSPAMRAAEQAHDSLRSVRTLRGIMPEMFNSDEEMPAALGELHEKAKGILRNIFLKRFGALKNARRMRISERLGDAVRGMATLKEERRAETVSGEKYEKRLRRLGKRKKRLEIILGIRKQGHDSGSQLYKEH